MRCPECRTVIFEQFGETEEEALKRHLRNCDGQDGDGFAGGECPMCGESFEYINDHLRRCSARGDTE